MVIAGVIMEKKAEKELMKLGVKDSKMLSPRRREELDQKIRDIIRKNSKVSSIITLPVPSCKIDMSRRRKVNLNKLEARVMGEIINMCEVDRIYVDALTAHPEKFKQLLLTHVHNKEINLIAENEADKKFPIVSAASIIAKVERDRAIEELKKKVNFDFGVGYSHDERTIAFVKKLIKEKKKLPSYVRKTWITTQTLQEKAWQRKLKDFINKMKV